MNYQHWMKGSNKNGGVILSCTFTNRCMHLYLCVQAGVAREREGQIMYGGGETKRTIEQEGRDQCWLPWQPRHLIFIHRGPYFPQSYPVHGNQVQRKVLQDTWNGSWKRLHFAPRIETEMEKYGRNPVSFLQLGPSIWTPYSYVLCSRCW